MVATTASFRNRMIASHHCEVGERKRAHAPVRTGQHSGLARHKIGVRRGHNELAQRESLPHRCLWAVAIVDEALTKEAARDI